MRRLFIRIVGPHLRLLLVVVCIFAVILVAAPYALPQLLKVLPTKAAGLNPIQQENQLPGDPTWNDFSASLDQTELSGYGSTISVNHGGSIDFYVTTKDPTFTIDIYRTGWYNGDGARKIESLGPFTGMQQAIPAPDPVTGIVVCNWKKTTTLNIPSTWVSGVYLARLDGSSGNKSFIFFVVRDDGGTEDILFQTSVTTYQAYNLYGGTSLYGMASGVTSFKGPHATKVSFDRPFNPGDSNGAGHYLFWEFKFVYWMESQGYNVAYTTDVDTDTNASTLTNHKAFLSVGHDEYWSAGMRNTVQNAINAGVNVGFFGANEMYWQIRFEPNAAGVPDRVEVGYKDYAETNTPPGPDPEWNVNNSIVTTNWRDPLVNKPENGIVGIMYEDQTLNDQDYNFVVANASSWVYAGTGFVNGSVVRGILGYEYDKVFNNGATPAGLTILGNSPVTGESVGNSTANASIYTAPSGAKVFAAGTIEWSLGLENIQGNTYANPGIQKATANILNAFISGTIPAYPTATLSPTSVNFGNQAVNTTSAAQTVTLTNSGTAALNISSVAISGTNASDFAQTNNCPASLAVNATCTFNIKFTPGAIGGRTAALTLTDNATDSPQSVSLIGAGVSPGPVVNFNPTSLTFAGQNVGSTSAAQTVTLTNTGTTTLNISSITLTGTNASDFAQTNNCPTSLAANASCTFNVTFTPSANGTRSAALTLTDNAADSPESVALSGTGAAVAPAVTFTPTSVAFGSQNVGTTSAVQTITLSNTGTADMNLSSITITGTNASDFTQTNNCGSVVADDSSCTIQVTFKPGAAGSRNASLTVTDNAPGSPQSVPLTGTGINPGTYFTDGFETGDFSLWTIPSSDSTGQKTVETTVVNSGTHAAQFTNAANQYTYIYTALPAAESQTYTRFYFRFSSMGGATELAMARNNTGNVWEVDYDPNLKGLDFFFWDASNNVYTLLTSANALAANTWYSIEVEDNEAAAGVGQAWLNGQSVGTVSGNFAASSSFSRLMLFDGATGTAYFDDVIVSNAYNGPINSAPAVQLNQTNLTFASQTVGTTSTPQTLTVTNSGSGTLNISNIAIGGTNASDFAQTNTCSAPLAPSASCSINVTFTPGAIGSRSGTLTLTDNAAGSPQSITLTGTGATAAPGVNLSPTTVSFGNQNVGTTSSAQQVTLSNNGSSTLTISSIAVSGTNASDFAQTNTCGASLAPNANCVISITFTPSATGSRSGAVTITDNATGSPQSVPLSGTGVTPTPAANVSPSSLTFANQNVGTPSSAQTITVQNTGTADLTISSITISGTNASDFAQTNNCGTSLAPNASCAINVTFTPGAAGSRSASVTITDNATGSPQSVTLSGTGVTSGTYFTDGFESGDFSKWTIPSSDSTGQKTVETSVVNSGTYAAQFTIASGQYAYIYTALPAAESLTYTRFYFQFTSMAGGTELAMGRNNNGTNAWEIDYDNNLKGLDIYFWDGKGGIYSLSTSANALTANTWYSIEIEDNQSTSGVGQAWLNGTSIGTVNADLSTTTPYSRLMLFDATAGTVYWDDVIVSNSYNGLTSHVVTQGTTTPGDILPPDMDTPKRSPILP
jgi:hypothetical protein